MEHLFEELDHDGSGEINLKELQERMYHPRVTAWLKALYLEVKQVGMMFQLIDVDKNGSIDRGEFIVGCTRLRGEARQLDVAILTYETRWLKRLLLTLGDHVDSLFAAGGLSPVVTKKEG